MTHSTDDILIKTSKTLYGACKFHKGERLLVAVSGGVDSVVLCRLLKELEIDFGIAHMNFQLRGDNSLADEAFVGEMAKQYGVPFYTKKVDTTKIVAQSNDSTQMVARTLRYEWFEDIRKTNGFHAIATAHHQNDTAETMLYNLTKGTGIAGLHGIRPRNGKIVRPLLALDKKELLEYAEVNELKFREDVSNQSIKYARNKIRHQVIPVLKELNPTLEQTLFETAERMAETEALYHFAIEQQQKKLLKWRGEDGFISLINLKKHIVSPKTVLWEILKTKGFSSKQIQDIMLSVENPAGQQFLSGSHRLLTTKRFLILSPYPIKEEGFKLINLNDKKAFVPEAMLSITSKKIAQYVPETNPKIATFDLDKITFPLTLRKWENGDYFYPMGLTKKNGEPGKQKLKKFFGNQKMNAFQKEKTWILEDFDKRILWVVGLRQDDRFKVTQTTKQFYRIHLEHVKEVMP